MDGQCNRLKALGLVMACTGLGAALGPAMALAQVPVPQPFPPPVPDTAPAVVAPVTATAVEAAKTVTDTASAVAGQVDSTPSPPPGGPPSAENVTRDTGGERIVPLAARAPAFRPSPHRGGGSAGPGESGASTTVRRPSSPVDADRAPVRRPVPAAETGSSDPESRGALPPFLRDASDSLRSVTGRVPDWSRPIIAALLALVMLSAVRAYLSGRRTRRLEAARRSLRADVDVLQAALVPSVPERIGGVEFSVAYRPADGLASGGDFYDVFALDDHRTAFLLGDVSGHDRIAIGRAAAVRHKLRAYLELGLEPRMVLQAAGETMAEGDSATGAFATAAVAVHDAEDGTLTYACAGHEPPILTGSAAHEPASVCFSAPLGWGLPTGRRQTTVALGARDCACFFTDGFIEARGHGGLLGRDGLVRLVDGLGGTGTATELIDDATAVARRFEDDIAVLVIRTPAAVAARSLRVEVVELDAEDMSRHATERFLASCDAPMPLISELTARAREAIDEAGRAVMRVHYDAETRELDALVEAVGEHARMV